MSEKSLLSFFWDLASTNENLRIEAAVSLIQYLRSNKNKAEVRNLKDTSAEDKPDDLSYTVKRLVKGLASSRKAARQGFAMALTEIILLFDQIKVEDIINYMKEALSVTKSSSSEEERSAYIGQVFGLVSLGRAICLAKDYKNVKIQKSSITLVIEKLKELLAKKSYLQETCYKAIVDIMAMLTFSEFQEFTLPILENDIKCSWDKCSPECLVLVFATWRFFKDDVGHKMFKKCWTSSRLDAVENYPLFAKILQNAYNSHTRVHTAWDEVFSLVLNSPKSDLKKFWMTVVDENLFQSSHERKFLGFKLLEKILPMLSLTQVEAVFSPQLMHCLFNTLAQNTNYLYASTKQMVEGVGSILVSKEKQVLIPEIIKQLLGRNGNICFDAVTKTKTIENLLSKLRQEDLHHFVSWLKEIFIAGTTSVENTSDEGAPSQVDKTREGILGVLLSLTRCKQLEHTSTWVLDVVFFVFERAYFVHKISRPISSRTRTQCQQRFNSILGELASFSGKQIANREVKKKDGSSGGQQKRFGYAEDGRLWISHIMHHAKDLLANEENKIVGQNWSEEVQGVFNKTMKIVRKLEQKSSEENPENNAFVLMFLYVGVQLFGETQQAHEILEELFHCFDKVRKKKTQENEPHWMDVVTEILLSLLTEPSNLRRQVVDQVFHIIVPHLTPSALKIILEAIDPRNGLNEDSALQIEDNEDEEMILEDENDQEEAEADELGDDQASDDDDDEDNNDDDDNDDDETKYSIDPLFKIDLQEALGDALANENDDENEDEEPDSDLDDEAMMQLDGALSEVFKQHLKARQEKKKFKDAKKSLLHFKFRVLDLVEIIIKKQPSSALILELIQPLLEIIRTCLTSKDFVTLGERAQGIFRNRLCSIKERPELSPAYVESAHENIEFLLQQAIKAPSVTMVTLMSAGCLFLIRQLRGKKEIKEKQSKKKGKDEEDEFGELDFSRVKTAYCEALKDFMLHRNTHLHPLLFQELINRNTMVGWCLGEDLVTYITNGINNFRKIQACTMLSQLFNKKVHSQSENIKVLAKPLQEAFHATFTQLSSSNAEMKAKHLRQILKLASQFVKILKSEPDLWSLLDAKQFEESLNAAAESKAAERAHDMKNFINCLKTEITGTTNVEMREKMSKKERKRKLSETTTANETSKNELQNEGCLDSKKIISKKKKKSKTKGEKVKK